MTVLTTDDVTDFYRAPDLAHLDPGRIGQVRDEIDRTGRYRHTREELHIGAKLAWRNHARCGGRFNWHSLQLLDARDVKTPDETAEVCWEHLRRSTNGGALRALITVFGQEEAGAKPTRIWSPQLIRYAGYRRSDGSVLGDPLHLELTELVTRMGWRGEGTRFDLLPVVIQMGDEPPRLYDVPRDCVLEVPIRHPDLPWFEELDLKWHANPAISDMSLEIGGIRYPSAPFSGWYVSSEIGARNLSDVDRYNMLPVVAARMGLDTRSPRSLWIDRALIELNQAVLYSYREAGVHIVDHHTMACQFVAHMDREHAQGRQVPAQWEWINPPLSASTTATFHHEYDAPDFGLRPNFVRNPGVGELSCPVSGAVQADEPSQTPDDEHAAARCAAAAGCPVHAGGPR